HELSELVTEFVNHNEARQERALAELGRSDFLTNYHNLQVWDLLSLYLCTIAEPKKQHFEPVPTDYNQASGIRISLAPRDIDQIKVEPYPFDVRPFKVHYAYKHLETYDFPTEDAFQEAYYAAVPKLRHFVFE